MILTILAVLFIIAAAFIAFKFIRHLLLAALLIMTLLTLFIAGVGLLVYNDAKDFKQNAMTKPSLILLAQSNTSSTLLAGIHIMPSLNNMSYVTLNETQLQDMQQMYALRQDDAMLDGNYKLIIITMPVIEDFPADTITFEGKAFTKNDTVELLMAQDALHITGKMISPKANDLAVETLKKRGMTSTSLKGELLGLYVSELFKEQYMPYTLEQVKSNRMTIYPETSLFKVMKYVPISWVEKVIGNSS